VYVHSATQRLEERGYVARRPDPVDGRFGVVELTAAGLALVDAAVTDHVATLDRLLGALDGQDRPALTAMLTAVERTAGAGGASGDPPLIGTGAESAARAAGLPRAWISSRPSASGTSSSPTVSSWLP
jgi:hypothetical protein